jgi:halimadienyl-diphosphate synthase
VAILEEIRAFLTRVGSSVENPTSYDTAWVAALQDPASSASDPVPRFPAALEWLADHQYPDGSWGCSWPYYHDRLISTLRAVLTLHQQAYSTTDRRRVERGIGYIWRNAERLRQDPWETVGFELIFPTLLAEAEQQGLVLPYDAFAAVQRIRQEKLARAPLHLIYDRTTALPINLEGLGPAFDPARAGEVQEEPGAVPMSPSATAFLLQQCPDNARARDYLVRVLDASLEPGGAPAYWPLETFERSWALYHFQHMMPEIYQVLPRETQPILQKLEEARTPRGWSPCRYSTIKDSDSTAVCFSVFSQAGYDLDPRLLYQYEEADCFRTYPFERNPSISANVHVLGALHYCDPGERASRVEKILGFLRRTRQPGGYWYDKWNVSPYYVTGRAILAARDFAPDLVAPAVEWLLHTQRPGGGWGYYAATMEETAYAVLALLGWAAAGHHIPKAPVRRGAEYLQRHFSPLSLDYPPLWIAKSLYVPVQVVQSAVLAALWACEVHE